jgi:magnesium transporter
VFKSLTVCQADNLVSVSEGDDSAVNPPAGCLRWIDHTKQDAESIALLGQRFSFHHLTLEDCLHFDQRPKLEVYDEYDFIVVHGFKVDWQVLWQSTALELHIFISPNVIITIHESDMPAVDTVWQRAFTDSRLLGQGVDNLCYHILDQLMDSYFPIIAEIEMKLDDLEDRVLNQPEEVQLAEIIDFKRLLIELRKIALPQRDVLATLARQGSRLITDRVQVYMRDVYDHALRLYGYIESARELVSNVRDAHLWTASQRTNEIMKRLTILSAIFLPLTFLTGFFGQNFHALPVENEYYYYGTIFCCIALPIAMMIYFVRSKWF